ncbi:MAG: glycosyltransferase family 2 protein [Acinetobacter sp.]
MKKIYAVIVTHNRQDLLLQCLDRLVSQTFVLENIVIVDNCSTDGTISRLKDEILLKNPKIKLISLKENTGGAGGFSVGMKYAFDDGADFVWMMDDDALPQKTALEELMNYATSDHIYGSLAINGDYTAWTTTLIYKAKSVNLKNDIPVLAEVQSLPFLGYLTSKEIYKNIGLPDSRYFISADDTEYCMRAQQAGYKTFICGKSFIEHPKSERYNFYFLGKKLICLKLVPWKRYYDTRNRLLIARKYYGFKMYTQTIPSILVRLIAALIHEDRKLLQIKAFLVGVYDGLIGKVGKRHDYWNL